MARLSRLSVPDYPHLVIQRSLNQQRVFADADDRKFYLETLFSAAKLHKCAIHAYVILENAAQLLITPREAVSLAGLMKSVSSAYTHYYNRSRLSRGTIWDGRYRSTIIDPQSEYTLQALIFLDQMAEDNIHGSPYSSHGVYAGSLTSSNLTMLDAYWKLGNTPFARENSYREAFASGLTFDVKQALTDSMIYGWPYGGEKFLNSLSSLIPGRRLARAKRGRPKRASSVPK